MLHAFWEILTELAPWLFVGAAVAGALHAIVPADALRRRLSGRWGVLNAAAIGVPLPLCSCAVIPVGLSLRKQGASRGATTAFLISTPETGVDSIFVSVAALGWPFAVVKVVSALVLGLTGGLLTDYFVGADEQPTAPPPQESTHKPSKWITGFAHAVAMLRGIWRWLVVGILISAAISVFAPQTGLDRLDQLGTFPAMLVALAIGAPLYVCATASVPIAAALMAQGLPPAAALVFLIAGPATNVATMGAVGRTLGRTALAIYLGTIAIGSMLCGWAFGWLLKAVGENPASHAAHHHGGSIVGVVAAGTLLALFAWFGWQELRAYLRPLPAVGSHPLALELPVLHEGHEH